MKVSKILVCILIAIAIIGLLGGIVLIICGQAAIAGIVWASTTLFSAIAVKRIASANNRAE